MNPPDDYLLMSGIQHFCFCRRQWGLIHLEQQWQENQRTAEGRLDHARCHDDGLTEKRGDLLIIRGMRVISHHLKLTGTCDVVEFHIDATGVPLQTTKVSGCQCLSNTNTVRQKNQMPTRLQLCAQAIALEEMLVCQIGHGAIYYVETRRREIVPLTPELREKAQSMANEMNLYFSRGHTPKSKPGKHCNACSLKELCLPALYQRADPASYLRAHIDEEVIP